MMRKISSRHHGGVSRGSPPPRPRTPRRPSWAAARRSLHPAYLTEFSLFQNANSDYDFSDVYTPEGSGAAQAFGSQQRA